MQQLPERYESYFTDFRNKIDFLIDCCAKTQSGAKTKSVFENQSYFLSLIYMAIFFGLIGLVSICS
jgi:hypothetical protein